MPKKKPKKPEKPTRKGEPRGDTRVSLNPLSTEEALRDLMATGKPLDELSDVALVREAIEDDEIEAEDPQPR